MTAKTLAVFRKEITDTLRDGRTIFAIFVFPFVLYPALLMLMAYIQHKNNDEAKTFAVQVGIVGSAQFPAAAEKVRAVEGVTVVSLVEVPANLDDAGVQAILVVPPDLAGLIARGDSVKVELLYKDADNMSSETAKRLKPALDDIRQSLTLAWAKSRGATADAPPALTVERKDVSSKKEVGRYVAALMIPYLLIFMVAAGSMQTAVDATTGEKERSTLETILASAATRAELVVGKVLAVLAASLTGAITGILGLWISFGILASRFSAMQSQSLELSIGPEKMVLLFLTLLPAAIFLSAVLVAIGCFARSMREGQTYATYVYMASVFLGLSSFSQSQSVPMKQFFIPILNTALLQREILTDTVQAAHAFAAIGSSSLLAAVMIVVAIRLFSNEQVLFRT
ncbi:MAG TPA: ABC transporter permease [Candidatus Eisenbacteria bacterium]|nr:ABC transporter permease [Candidatus Eisenbacteria bacterium]